MYPLATFFSKTSRRRALFVALSWFVAAQASTRVLITVDEALELAKQALYYANSEASTIAIPALHYASVVSRSYR